MKKLLWNEARKQLEKGEYFLMFTTTWCNDCKMMYPVIKDLEKDSKNLFPNLKFIEIDGEEAKLFRDKNAPINVLKVPSFYFVKNGKYYFIGYEYLPLELLKQNIKNNLQNE